MQITINTDTDDLPAVIRMLEALHGESPRARANKIYDSVQKRTPVPTMQTGPVVKIAGVPADKLYTGDALKTAADSLAPIETDEPDHAADANEPDHEDGPEFAGFEQRSAPTPEQVFAAPKSLFDAPRPPTIEGYVRGAGGTGGNDIPPTHLDVTVDAAGLPWDARIHSGAKSKLANGNWKLLRGVDPALVASVEAELRGAPKPEPLGTAGTGTTVNAPAQAPAPAVSPPPPPAPIAATPSAPPAPPAPPATPIASVAPKPITNAAELVAAVMDKRFTTDQVNAACQAVGVENVASLLAKQDKLPAVLKELGV